MAWRNPHRQTISDLSAFPKHLLLSPALLELPHWLLVNYANKVMFETYSFFFCFFCNRASLHSLPPSSRGTIRVTEHVSKIYASVTNYNALSLISPLLLLRLRSGLVMCLPFGEAFGCEFYCFSLFLSLFPAYQCVTSLHICRDRRLQPKRVSSRVWLITGRNKVYFGVSLFWEWLWGWQMGWQGVGNFYLRNLEHHETWGSSL